MCAAVAVIAVMGPAAVATTGAAETANALRDVVLVGNSVQGTVSFLDGHTFRNLGS